MTEPPDADGFSNEKAVLGVIFRLAKEKTPYSVRLDRIDDVDLKALVKQKAIERQPAYS